MSEVDNPITPETTIELKQKPKSKPEAKKELKCPSGFPQEKWNRWCEAERRNYLKIIEQSERITGGK